MREAGVDKSGAHRCNSLLLKAVCVPSYIGYVLVCVYGINGTLGFAAGFWQLLVILSVMNLLDRFLIDGYRVGHTNAWTIPRNRGSQTVHYRKRQAEKMAFRYGRHGGHSGCAGGNYDGFYSLRKEPMKYKIEKNTVQETLILPLYSRKLCTELYPNLYRDETAVRLLDQIDYGFSEVEKNSRSLMQRFGALEVAMRQNDLAFEVRAYLKKHPSAAVVNLGCGLDNTGRACDNGRCKIYNLDFPDVIALRQQLLPAGEREQNIPCDLKDTVLVDAFNVCITVLL